MVYCLSCEKYPRDKKVIPSGSIFPTNVYKVRLISQNLPNPLPASGADVFGLADSTLFSVGSILYVVNGTNGGEIYVYDSEQFVLWASIEHGYTPTGGKWSDVVGIGQVGYMVLRL